MKKIITICLVAIMSLTFGSLSAQQPKSAPNKKEVIVTTTFSADTNAPGAEKKIKTLSKERGVKGVQIDKKKNKVTVKYDKSQTSESEIIKAFNRLKIKEVVKAITKNK